MAFNVTIFFSHKISERLLLLKKQGEYISKIKYYGFIIDLYILNKNFIEVYYNIHSNKVEKVEVLELTNDMLNLFAVQVNLSNLYKK